MPELPPGAVLHWKNFLTTQSKYLLVLGTNPEQVILAFTITSQDHWLAIHRPLMIEIPAGSTNFLSKTSYIPCFFPLERISQTEYEQGKLDGDVTIAGSLRKSFLAKVRDAVDNDLLVQSDIDDALAVLNKALSASISN